MYIEYDVNQQQIWDSDGLLCPSLGINHLGESEFNRAKYVTESSEKLKMPKFRPSRLVRVEDMQVVPGRPVKEQYWALSYSWNQSGKIIKKGHEEYDRIDEGKHKINTYQTRTVQRDWRQVQEIVPNTKQSRSVQFEQVIQQICTDFHIQYIWFDRMCINQDDHNEKMEEIKQMHLIYENARCTVALIPELKFKGDTDNFGKKFVDIHAIENSEWCKRAWTLEEAYMSKNLLIVGQNVHLWSSYLKFVRLHHFLDNILHSGTGKWTANVALWFARSRTSSKAHDRVFALVNMFPKLKGSITFSYTQPLEDLMTQFYGLLAQKDPSILLFGAPLDPASDHNMMVTRQKEARLLPSWSGSSGVHLPNHPSCRASIRIDVDQYIVVGRYLHMKSTLVPVRIEKPDSVKIPNGAMNRLRYTNDGLPANMLDNHRGYVNHIISTHDRKYLTFVTTTAESQMKHNYCISLDGVRATHILPLKVGTDGIAVNTLLSPGVYCGVLSLTEEYCECLIVSGISYIFDRNNGQIVMPVIGRKSGQNHYKSIGIYITYNMQIDPAIEITRNVVIE